MPLGRIAQFPVEMFDAGCSKDQELKADREGANSMFRKFWKLKDEVHQYRAQGPQRRTVLTLRIELGNVVVLQTLEGYFRTHRPESERIAQMERLMAAEHWPGDQRQKTLAVAYC